MAATSIATANYMIGSKNRKMLFEEERKALEYNQQNKEF